MTAAPPWVLALLLLAPALAGCVAPPADLPSPSAAEALLAPPEMQHVLFTVLSVNGGSLEMPGLAWFPTEPSDAALLAVQGGNGGKGEWAPLSIAGYSLGERLAAGGRAFFAVDYPGQGTSAGAGVTTFEDTVSAFDQIARAIREGSYENEDGKPHAFPLVAALGHSVGGGVVLAAQGTFRTFDGVALASFALAGYTDRFRECFAGLDAEGGCGEDLVWFLENADPAVIVMVTARYNDTAQTTLIGNFAWVGCAGCLPDDAGGTPVPTPLRMAASRVDVPVFLLMGAEDHVYDTSEFDREEAAYAATPDIETTIIPAAGHVLFHHRNRQDVYATLDDWLAKRGF